MSNESYTEPHPMNIPQELRALDQWVIRDEQKRPINARTRKLASPTDPATWSTFPQALKADPDRLGFVFARMNGLVGLDVDDCRNAETSEIDDRGRGLVERFPHIYWELSVSGTGLHGIGRGVLPAETSGKHPKGIGIFHHSRYFVMTGHALPGHETLGDFGDGLAAWYREMFPPEPEQPVSPPPTLTMDDRDILDRLVNEQNGKARQLLAGDIIGYPDYSSARFALANKLCFYSDDPDQIERIIRTSGLFKDADRDRDRDRKARLEATKVVSEYVGPRYEPNRRRGEPPPRPEPMAATSDPQDITGDTCADVRAELATARETIKQLQRDKSMLMALLLNPYVTSAEKTAVAATLDKSIRKQPGEDGLVALKPGEIANDWRPRAKPGENTEPLNRDGSKPRMSRSAVKRMMMDLADRKFIEATPHERVVEPKGREPYKETVWLVKPPDSAADFLAPIALFQPADVTTRKPRTITPQCADCGVDLISVTTWTVTEGTCPECGQVHTEASKPRTVTPIVSIEPDVCAGAHVDKRSTVRSVGTSTVDKRSTRSAPPLDDEPRDSWIPPDDQHRYRPRTGEGAGNDRWTA